MKARDFIDTSSLLQIVVANMRDGIKLGAHSGRFARLLAGRTKQRLADKIADGTAAAVPTAKEILAAFEDVCHGIGPLDAFGYMIRPGTRYLLRNQPTCPITEDWYSTVTTLDHLETLVPDDEWRRLFDPLANKTGNPSYDPFVTAVLKPDWRGSFKVGANFSLGNPIAWFTPRTELRRAIDGKPSLADATRDWLGLIHRAEPTHLVTLHFHAAALGSLRSGRPTFADATRNSRFMLAAAGVPPPYPVEWGQTLALDLFALNAVLADGAKERVFSRISASDIGDLAIGVTYLGALTETRGVVGPVRTGIAGTHAEFAEAQIVRDRAAYDTMADSL